MLTISKGVKEKTSREAVGKAGELVAINECGGAVEQEGTGSEKRMCGCRRVDKTVSNGISCDLAMFMGLALLCLLGDISQNGRSTKCRARMMPTQQTHSDDSN